MLVAPNTTAIAANRMHELPTPATTRFSIVNLLRDEIDFEEEGEDDPLHMTNKAQRQRMKANARERGRVHTIGAAFNALRRSVPVRKECKLSKVSTLRIAAAYIETLTAFLEANPRGGPSEDQPEDLSTKRRPLDARPLSPTTKAEAEARFNDCSRRLKARISMECKAPCSR